MATLFEDTANKTRRLPIQQSLRRLLIAAADLCGVDHVLVYSGGQPAAPGGPRTGSTRHDHGNAADLQLFVGGQVQSMETTAGRAIMAAYCRNCAALGATGIGAGPGYMGPHGIHVGYGSKAVWGRNGMRAHAPGWLVEAVTDGWQHPIDIDEVTLPPVVTPNGGAVAGLFVVNARPSLRLRGGPGVQFPQIGSLPTGTAVTVVSFDHDWALVDLLSDGTADGHVHRAFLVPAAA